MADKRRNPYESYPQEIISPDVIAGYTKKYLDKYMKTKVEGEHFMPLLFSVMHHESSGMNKWIKASGYEGSFGLFQINWRVHATDIVNNYPQFKAAGIQDMDISEMDENTYANLVELMGDLDFQFSFARRLMDNRNAKGQNIFADWSAYNNGGYKQHFNNYVSVVQPYESMSDADLLNLANSYTSGPVNPPTNPPGGDPIGGTDPADTNLISGAPTDPLEKWKQIKQAYGGKFYDYANDKWIGDYENQSGVKQWETIFQVGLKGDLNTSYADWYANSASDFNGTLDKAWGAISNQEGFFNPFQLSALRGAPTMADTVKIAVYNRFLRSASNAGFSASVAQSIALQHLANPIAIDRMNRAVGYGMERNLSVEELINIVSHDISNYQHEQDRKEWAFRIPDYQDTTAQEVASLNEKINRKVSSVLLQDSPYLTDEIRRAYTDYKIINPNTQVSIEDFSMPFIKQTDRYKRIYNQKPAMFSPEQYINQYIQGVGSVMAPGDPNYQEMIASQASMGGTAQEAQTGAFFGSANVGLGDTFRNKVSSLGERIGALFNK